MGSSFDMIDMTWNSPCDNRFCSNALPFTNHCFPGQRLQQVPETENILVDNFVVQSNSSLQSTLNPVREHLSTPVEEPQKHTYASILQVAKGQSAPAVPAQSSFNKTTPPGSEWNHVSYPLP